MVVFLAAGNMNFDHVFTSSGGPPAADLLRASRLVLMPVTLAHDRRPFFALVVVNYKMSSFIKVWGVLVARPASFSVSVSQFQMV